MKILRFAITACFLLLSAIFLLSMYPPGKGNGYEERFTLIAPIAWNKIAPGIMAADADFGTNTKLVGASDLNEEDFIREIQNAVRTEVDGIITAGAFDTEEMDRVIREAEDAGIPVVIIDSDLPESARSAYVGTNNYEAGAAAGKDLVEATNGSAKVAVVVSELKAVNQRERLEGFRDILKEEAGMQVVEVLECHSNYLELAEKVPQILDQQGEINALCFLEGRAGSALGNILEHQYDAGNSLQVVAFDDSDTILNCVSRGIYYSTIMQKRFDEGYKAVETLHNMMQGEHDENVDTIYTGVESIRKSEADNLERETDGEIIWHYY